MQDFGDSQTRRSSHSTNPEVERRQPRRDTARPNFPAVGNNEQKEKRDAGKRRHETMLWEEGQQADIHTRQASGVNKLVGSTERGF